MLTKREKEIALDLFNSGKQEAARQFIINVNSKPRFGTMLTGTGKCFKKGHRPINRNGQCSRCGEQLTKERATQ